MFSSPTPRSSSLYKPETEEENTDQEENAKDGAASLNEDKSCESNEVESADYSEVDEDIPIEYGWQSTGHSESEEDIEEAGPSEEGEEEDKEEEEEEEVEEEVG